MWQCTKCGKKQGFKWSGNGCPKGGDHVVVKVSRASYNFSNLVWYKG